MLNEGDAAPKFTLEGDDGAKVSLGNFAGQMLVLYFYPKDSTPGCTLEAQGFSAAIKNFKKAGAAVVGISKDSIASHVRFREKYKLGFALLSDPELVVHNAFGTYGEKTLYGKKMMGTIRSTFIIGKKGKIMRVFPKVKVTGHVEEVLAAVNELSAK
jgi:thioredoxin-dependent peroxiredoxin